MIFCTQIASDGYSKPHKPGKAMWSRTETYLEWSIPMGFFSSRLLPVLLVGVLALPVLGVEKGWTVDYEGAKAKAVKEGKDMLLEFTGSDWCPPCKFLKKNVLSTEKFMTEMPKNFVLVYLDFPRSKPQSDKVKKQNAKLNGQYQVSGYPTIYLTDAKGRPYGFMVGARARTPEAFLKLVKEWKEKKAKRDASFAKAAKAKGVKKAKLLDEGLQALDKELRTTFYTDVIAEIIKADANNKGNLKEKYEATLAAIKIEKKLKAIESGIQVSGKFKEAIIKIDALIKDEKLKGASLQEALFMKALLLYRTNKKDESKATLIKARDAAPKSDKAKRINQILQRAFQTN